MAIRVGILTVSDKASRGERLATAGRALAALMKIYGAEIAERATLPDERDQIERQLRQWGDDAGLDVVLTAGGTGLSPRGGTPGAHTPAGGRRAETPPPGALIAGRGRDPRRHAHRQPAGQRARRPREPAGDH